MGVVGDAERTVILGVIVRVVEEERLVMMAAEAVIVVMAVKVIGVIGGGDNGDGDDGAWQCW